MSQLRNGLLLVSACIVLMGALLHLAIPLGGPDWYQFFGAPAGLVTMVKAGAIRPAITCAAIATVLAVLAAYGFSGAGVIRRLPLLRLVLGFVGVGLIVRGLTFVPIALWRPQLLLGLCGKCQEVGPFLVVTSVLCLLVGIGYTSGAVRVRI